MVHGDWNWAVSKHYACGFNNDPRFIQHWVEGNKGLRNVFASLLGCWRSRCFASTSQCDEGNRMFIAHWAGSMQEHHLCRCCRSPNGRRSPVDQKGTELTYSGHCRVAGPSLELQPSAQYFNVHCRPFTFPQRFKVGKCKYVLKIVGNILLMAKPFPYTTSIDCLYQLIRWYQLVFRGSCWKWQLLRSSRTKAQMWYCGVLGNIFHFQCTSWVCSTHAVHSWNYFVY